MGQCPHFESAKAPLEHSCTDSKTLIFKESYIWNSACLRFQPRIPGCRLLGAPSDDHKISSRRQPSSQAVAEFNTLKSCRAGWSGWKLMTRRGQAQSLAPLISGDLPLGCSAVFLYTPTTGDGPTIVDNHSYRIIRSGSILTNLTSEGARREPSRPLRKVGR